MTKNTLKQLAMLVVSSFIIITLNSCLMMPLMMPFMQRGDDDKPPEEKTKAIPDEKTSQPSAAKGEKPASRLDCQSCHLGQ